MSKEERFEYESSDLFGDTIIDNKENKRIDDDLSIIARLLNQQDQKIADLEAKLAEQYTEVEKVETHYLKQREYYTKEFNEIIDNLKQQLATQENTITNLVEDNRASQEWYKKQLADKEKEIEEMRHFKITIGTMENNRVDISSTTYTDQKIDFAIEQLEKVRKELEFNSNNNEWITIRDDRLLNGICDFIDNQIKELKEGK